MKYSFEKGYTPWNKKEEFSKTCEVCKKTFKRTTTVNWVQFEKQRFCSYRCSSMSWRGRKVLNRSERTCKQCNLIFQKPYGYSEKQWRTREFCSNKCSFRFKDTGYTKEKNRIYKTSAYVNWRRAVFTRDKYTCQFCGQVGGKLQADHIISVKEARATNRLELITDISNGRTLCHECHKTTPTYGWKGAALCV